MNNNIDIYHLSESDIKKYLPELLDKKYKLNFIDQADYKNANNLTAGIIIFEEESFVTSRELFGQILSMYKKTPASIIFSNNNEIFNVVCWMRNKANDYLVKSELDKDVLNNSINGSIEFNQIVQGNYKDIQVKHNKLNYEPVNLPLSVNWDSLKNNDKYDIAVVMIEIIMEKKNFAKYSTASIDSIYIQIKTESNRIANTFGGKVWFWNKNFGILVFHFGDKINCAVLSAMTFFNTFYLICVEKLKLKEILNFKIGVNEGNAIFHNTNTENITSDVINSVSHLTQKYTESNTLNIMENVYEKLHPNIKKSFFKTSVFNNKPVFSYTYFKYD